MKVAHLRIDKLAQEDALYIRRWPSYPEKYAKLDYALRKGGWLDQFPEKAGNFRFAAWVEGRLVGFSILNPTGKREAEFYIAVHPKKLGQGLGKKLTERIVREGFTKLRLKRIHLKVRDWHTDAIKLYKRVGFGETKKKKLKWRGETIRFVIMEIHAADWKAEVSRRI